MKTLKEIKSLISKEELTIMYYEKGMCQADIAKYLDTPNNRISDLFKWYNIPTDNRYKRTFSFNENFFDIWSSDMAYILGFIISDGNIRESLLRIELQKKDVEVLDYIKTSMSSTQEVKFRNRFDTRTQKIYESTFFYLNSSKMIKTLASMGVIPNKSGKEICPENIPVQFIPDFLRGVMDGDGNIQCKNIVSDGKHYKSFCIQIASSSELFLIQLKDRLMKGLGRIFKNENCYVWELRSRNEIVDVLNYIYNGNFCLERKHKKYLEILEYHNKMSSNKVSRGTIKGWSNYKENNNINFSKEYKSFILS
jgi:hypothetical protein